MFDQQIPQKKLVDWLELRELSIEQTKHELNIMY